MYSAWMRSSTRSAFPCARSDLHIPSVSASSSHRASRLEQLTASRMQRAILVSRIMPLSKSMLKLHTAGSPVRMRAWRASGTEIQRRLFIQMRAWRASGTEIQRRLFIQMRTWKSPDGPRAAAICRNPPAEVRAVLIGDPLRNFESLSLYRLGETSSRRTQFPLAGP